MNIKYFIGLGIIISGCCLVAGMILLLSSCTSHSLHKKWQPLINDNEILSKTLIDISEKYNQPAIATALIMGDSINVKAAGGYLLHGEKQPVNINSLFHIGSTTKSMTSLLIAMLVSEGRLHYDMTLEQALPDIPMLEAYRKVTIHELLLNKAGIIAFQKTDYENPAIVERFWKDIPAHYSDPKAQRIEIAKAALNLSPLYTPGTKVVYSNVGWAIAGLIAELSANQSYEILVNQRIFKPLGMKTARIGGWPASLDEQDQPRGHYINEESTMVTPQALDDEYFFPSWMNPSGGVNCSIGDFALYAQENLLGLQGKGLLLNKARYQTIHSIHITANINEMYIDMKENAEITMGYGWAVIPVDGQSLSIADGSGGTFYARIIIYPALNIAFVGLTNTGNGANALDEAIERITGFEWNS